jgi:hypothetical protein
MDIIVDVDATVGHELCQRCSACHSNTQRAISFGAAGSSAADPSAALPETDLFVLSAVYCADSIMFVSVTGSFGILVLMILDLGQALAGI